MKTLLLIILFLTLSTSVSYTQQPECPPVLLFQDSSNTMPWHYDLHEVISSFKEASIPVYKYGDYVKMFQPSYNPPNANYSKKKFITAVYSPIHRVAVEFDNSNTLYSVSQWFKTSSDSIFNNMLLYLDNVGKYEAEYGNTLFYTIACGDSPYYLWIRLIKNNNEVILIYEKFDVREAE